MSSSGGSSISSASSGGSERADSPVQSTAAPVVGWKEWAFGGRGAPATGVMGETGAEIRDEDGARKEDLSGETFSLLFATILPVDVLT